MTDPRSQPPAEASAPTTSIERSSGSLTRGFLFADLRGYTAFVEEHGAAETVDLLVRYRALVRDTVKRFGGAEIKTEGDSFFVVFPSVSDAVECGLSIVDGARSETVVVDTAPIRVGIGVHAGETVELADGYVGTPVNVAARVCALAGPNEVLATDTVRALVSSVLPVRFERGSRRQLKGISEPVAVYRVVAAGAAEQPGATRRQRSMTRPILIGLVVIGLAATLSSVAVLSQGPASPAPSSRAVAFDTPSLAPVATASGKATPAATGTPTRAPAATRATALPIPNGVELVPGTYRTQLMRPVVTFTADAGWTTFGDAFGDSDGALDLGRVDQPGNRVTIMWSDRTSTDGCIQRTAVTDVSGGTGDLKAVPGSLPAVTHLIRQGYLSNGRWIARSPDPAIGLQMFSSGLRVVSYAAIDVSAARSPRCAVTQPRGLALFHRSASPGGEAAADDWTYLPRSAAARIIPGDFTMQPGEARFPDGELILLIQSANSRDLESFVGEAEKLLNTLYVWPYPDSDPPPL